MKTLYFLFVTEPPPLTKNTPLLIPFSFFRFGLFVCLLVCFWLGCLFVVVVFLGGVFLRSRLSENSQSLLIMLVSLFVFISFSGISKDKASGFRKPLPLPVSKQTLQTPKSISGPVTQGQGSVSISPSTRQACVSPCVITRVGFHRQRSG